MDSGGPHTIGDVIVNIKHIVHHSNTNIGIVIGNARFSQENRPTIGNYIIICVGFKAYGKIML